MKKVLGMFFMFLILNSIMISCDDSDSCTVKSEMVGTWVASNCGAPNYYRLSSQIKAV